MELVVATLNLRPLLPGRASTVVPSNALAREAPPLLLFVLLRGVTGGFLPLNVVVVGAEAAVAVSTGGNAVDARSPWRKWHLPRRRHSFCFDHDVSLADLDVSDLSSPA